MNYINNTRLVKNQKKGNNMPVHKVNGKWRFGTKGKLYSSKAQAEKQARAIYASGWKEK